jgi:hypothetical protein
VQGHFFRVLGYERKNILICCAALSKNRNPFAHRLVNNSIMDQFNRLFTEHPASVGESYGEHLVQASRFGTRMIVAGLACLVHGLLPFLFLRTGSTAINELHTRMVTHRRRHPSADASVTAKAS